MAMKSGISKRLLQVAGRLEKCADSRISFDRFVQDVNETHDGLAQTLESTEGMRELLERSGYPELAGRMNEVLTRIREVSGVLETLRKMYSQGKLRYGPRVPINVWEKRTIREKSPFETQERPRPFRETRKIDVDS